MAFDRASCALVLSAIALGGNSKLGDLVGTMDYLNRGWPSADQFESAVQELLGMGLIEESAPLRFKVTPEGRDLWKRTGRGGVIRRYLRVMPLLPLGSPRDWTLDREAYSAAEHDYHRSMDALLNRPD
jgi:hypothetical protein